MTWNSRAIKHKIPELTHFVKLHDIDVILIQETWLFPSITFKLPGYVCYRADRCYKNTPQHGGVAIFVNNSLIHSEFKSHK
jgi:exonuclease III